MIHCTVCRVVCVAALLICGMGPPLFADAGRPTPEQSGGADKTSNRDPFMRLAGEALVDERLEEAREFYAKAFESEASGGRDSPAVLGILVTFEAEGGFDKRGCLAWVSGRFKDPENRQILFQAVAAHSGLSPAPADMAQRIKSDEDVMHDAKLDSSPAPASVAKYIDVEALSENGNGEQSGAINWDAIERQLRAQATAELVRQAKELMQKGEAEEARELCAIAVSYEPDSQTVSEAAMGIVASFLVENELDIKALRAWAQENVPEQTDRLRVNLAVGEYLYRNQQYDRAIAELQPIADAEGVVAHSATLIIALCRLARGQQEEAVRQVQEVAAESKSPGIASRAMFLHGWMLVQAQQYEEAAQVFTNLMREYPQSEFAPKAKELLTM